MSLPVLLASLLGFLVITLVQVLGLRGGSGMPMARVASLLRGGLDRLGGGLRLGGRGGLLLAGLLGSSRSTVRGSAPMLSILCLEQLELCLGCLSRLSLQLHIKLPQLYPGLHHLKLGLRGRGSLRNGLSPHIEVVLILLACALTTLGLVPCALFRSRVPFCRAHDPHEKCESCYLHTGNWNAGFVGETELLLPRMQAPPVRIQRTFQSLASCVVRYKTPSILQTVMNAVPGVRTISLADATPTNVILFYQAESTIHIRFDVAHVSGRRCIGGCVQHGGTRASRRERVHTTGLNQIYTEKWKRK